MYWLVLVHDNIIERAKSNPNYDIHNGKEINLKTRYTTAADYINDPELYTPKQRLSLATENLPVKKKNSWRKVRNLKTEEKYLFFFHK